MEQPKLDWQRAHPNEDESVYVPFRDPLDAEWFNAVNGVLTQHNSETRGNPWGMVSLSADGSGFIVEAVEPGSRPALEGYLDTVLNVSAQHHQRDAARSQKQAQAEAHEERERAERMKRLQDEFGSG